MGPKSVLAIISLFLIVHWANGSNILVIFSSVSKSHNVLGVKLVEGLLKRGHHVTFANPFPTPQMENLTVIHMSSISKFFTDVTSKPAPFEEGFMGNFQRINLFLTSPNEMFWSDTSIQKIIKEKPKYDLLITLTFFNDAILGLGHHLGVPTIVFNCIGTFTLFNNFVANPTMVYSRNAMAGLATDTFWGRLKTVTVNMAMGAIDIFIVSPYNQGLLDKHLPNSPPLSVLQKEVSLVLASSHYSIETARPYVPNMIQIGGYHVQNVKPLPAEFKKFLDNAEKGAILFSLGGNVKVAMLGPKKVEAMFKVLGELAPMRVIFKSDMEHDNVPKNIMVRNWVPQADILAHPKTRLFIAHGGLGGVTESVYHGVPILFLPFVGDQTTNSQEGKLAGYGDILKPDDITEETFRDKVNNMLKDPKYTKIVKSRSALMKEQPVTPMENAMFWIEHVIKYGGGKHLQNPGVHLTWYQLYMVDIYIFYTVVLLLLLVINIYAIKFTIRVVKKLLGKSKQQKKQKKS
ncbi:UDP-glycosyltransferase UGT5-like [Harmonia axyridis]|uniref:UDP-glycosyltransferase UGT5-like n=1 Tax=Harmonia axyridis TaxID=115357 RepID=UPI001E276761|nr:UDP-glycosyltransferase UGT5-like [Harmonia axyridis]